MCRSGIHEEERSGASDVIKHRSCTVADVCSLFELLKSQAAVRSLKERAQTTKPP